MKYLITATLIAGSDAGPMHGSDVKVRLYDRDFFEDDFLGEARPNKLGEVAFEVDEKQMNRGILEDQKPDFFFVVYRKELMVFKSQVMENLDPAALGNPGEHHAQVIDLGTFLIHG
jgi:hypothetical protein